MFKTIHECRLDLVGHSFQVGKDEQGDYIGDCNFFPCSAARASFGNEDKTGNDVEADRKLMKYLADNDHLSPFEHQSVTSLIEVPLFIRSQIMRHRTFAYNEISRRYTDENIEFWIPDTFRKQSKSNKQASSNEVVQPVGGIENWKWYVGAAKGYYDNLIEHGCSREQARAVLPQSLLTKFYMTGNLRNWVHFLKLRLDDHAQYEARVVAERIKDHLLQLWPTATKVLLDAK